MGARGKPVRRNRGFRERRLEILSSASSLFARKGFAGATMEEIAERAGMAVGNLYYYFPSKQDLLYFCQDESLGRLIGQAEEILGSGMPAQDKLRALIAAHIRTVLEELPGATAHTDFRSLPPDRLRRIIRKRDRYEKVYRQVIESGIEDGVFKAPDPKTAVWAILGSLNWVVQWYSPKGALTPRQIAGGLENFFLSGLVAD